MNCMHLAGIYATAHTAHTHFMTTDSLYTDAYAQLVMFLTFFYAHLECEPIYFSYFRAQKPFMSRKDSQVIHKGSLLQRVYAPQLSPLTQLHLLHSG